MVLLADKHADSPVVTQAALFGQDSDSVFYFHAWLKKKNSY